MTTHEPDEPSPLSPRRLEALARGPAPPAGLEERTVRRLHRVGLLRASARGRRRLLAWAASVALAFALGAGAGRWSLARRTDGAGDGGSRYLVLLHRDPRAAAELSAEEHERHRREYSAWARARAGSVLAGAELDDAEILVSRAPGGAADVQRRPPARATSTLRGWFLVRARDASAAVALAATMPHLEDGWIELRRVHGGRSSPDGDADPR